MQIETHDDSGIVGFVPVMWGTWTNYLPSSGQGFGHDIIEHGACGKQTGAFDEELAAHGAVLFTTEFLATENAHPIYTPAQSLASGMASSQYQESTVNYIREPPKHRGISWDERRQLKEFAVEYVGAMMLEYAREVNDRCYCDEGECDCERINPFEGKDAFRRIFGWLLYGYSRAKRTYKGDCCGAYNLKKEIDRESKKAMGHFSEYADSGAIFTMRLDLNTEEVTIKPPRDIYGEW
jgi:hypothetical protein